MEIAQIMAQAEKARNFQRMFNYRGPVRRGGPPRSDGIDELFPENLILQAGLFAFSDGSSPEVESLIYTKSNLRMGQEMHKAYKAADVVDGVAIKEYAGIKGIRPDFVDFKNNTIYELKPFNPRAIQAGTKQLEKYKTIFELQRGGTWKTVLDHY